MGLWSSVFARLYDPYMAGTEKAGLGDRRRALLQRVSGDVVEIGAGTGVNLAHYPAAGIRRLVLVEPEAPMAARLRRKLAGSSLPAEVVSAGAERLPLPDAGFDFAVCTLVLCTVDHPDQALAEITRVLRPGGTLLFLEHVRSEDPARARWQDRLAPVWQRFAGGCRCNRDTAVAITAAGFAMQECERSRMPKSIPLLRPLIAGRAQRPG